MKYLKTFEGHATFKPGSLIEFHIPNTGKTHTGRIIMMKNLDYQKKNLDSAYEN